MVDSFSDICGGCTAICGAGGVVTASAAASATAFAVVTAAGGGRGIKRVRKFVNVP